MHAAPTVSGGRVFAEDVNDAMFAFDEGSGAQLWTYQALAEPARIIAATSPAVENETLVSSFASGEVVALRAANGNELWNASLSRANRTNALSEIRDIPGRPVIYKSDVYAVSHSDVFAAVDLRTGQVRWTLPVSALTTPWAVGDVVYVIDDSGQVICVSRESGQVYWIHDLNAAAKKKQRAYWSTPILASNRLITVSSKGEAVAMNPKTGAMDRTLRLGGDAMIGAIAVNGTLCVVSKSAQSRSVERASPWSGLPSSAAQTGQVDPVQSAGWAALGHRRRRPRGDGTAGSHPAGWAISTLSLDTAGRRTSLTRIPGAHAPGRAGYLRTQVVLF
jgi:outer membrane protein assembly factor BamB